LGGLVGWVGGWVASMLAEGEMQQLRHQSV
jgi:hypothetical protein